MVSEITNTIIHQYMSDPASQWKSLISVINLIIAQQSRQTSFNMFRPTNGSVFGQQQQNNLQEMHLSAE